MQFPESQFAINFIAKHCLRSDFYVLIIERFLRGSPAMPSLQRRLTRTAVVLLVLCGLAGVPASGRLLQPQPAMYAHFINVGQADCTLLEFPCGAILIDADTQSDEHTTDLINQLEHFSVGRPDLGETIETVFITHSHIDHTGALREIAERFTIRNIVDNGHATHSGGADQRWIIAEVEAGRSDISIWHVTDAEVAMLPHRRGLTDAAIDSLDCGDCGPVIRILAASYKENPGWPSGDFENENNHSLVIRVDFAESSFLFSGDLQERSIETLIEYCQGTETLYIDIYQVGHHGSHNATTRELLKTITPHAAIISMGFWEFGRQLEGSGTPVLDIPLWSSQSGDCRAARRRDPRIPKPPNHRYGRAARVTSSSTHCASVSKQRAGTAPSEFVRNSRETIGLPWIIENF